MKILISYRGAPRIRGWETGAMLADAFVKLGHQVDEYAKIYEKPEWVQDRTPLFLKEYDLHIFMECNDGDPQYVELKNINAKKRVAWLFDIEMMPKFYSQLVSHMEFDYCYLANPSFIDTLSCPTGYLPYAADERFRRRLDNTKVRDVCLIGSDRPERRKLIRSLQKDNINAELISDLFKDDYINALASSKIVINDPAGGGGNLISMRLFEAMAAGSYLVQYDLDQLRQVAEPGICCATFNSPESLLENIQLVLKDSNIYERTRASGQFWIMSYHTYINRAKEILNDY